eukprot:364521-Chlamydomonas_euryale.AAC.13
MHDGGLQEAVIQAWCKAQGDGDLLWARALAIVRNAGLLAYPCGQIRWLTYAGAFAGLHMRRWVTYAGGFAGLPTQARLLAYLWGRVCWLTYAAAGLPTRARLLAYLCAQIRWHTHAGRSAGLAMRAGLRASPLASLCVRACWLIYAVTGLPVCGALGRLVTNSTGPIAVVDHGLTVAILRRQEG